jgi:hypothetical protein
VSRRAVEDGPFKLNSPAKSHHLKDFGTIDKSRTPVDFLAQELRS